MRRKENDHDVPRSESRRRGEAATAAPGVRRRAESARQPRIPRSRPRSTSSAFFPITPAPSGRGAPRRRRRSTGLRSAITSSICIACSNRALRRRPGPPERSMARRVARSEWAQEAIGFLLAAYLRLVRRTSRFTTVPADLDAFVEGELPVIAAMWHGQHLMMPLARPKAMVGSRSSFRAMKTPAPRRWPPSGSTSSRCAARADLPTASTTRAARWRCAN